jgi:hypothetical protein
LPANAICLCHPFRLTHRIRQQAGSYRSVSCLDKSANATPGVGARLPANAICLRHPLRLIHRLRQQAGSYGIGGVSGSFVVRKSFAGKRAPAVICLQRGICAMR